MGSRITTNKMIMSNDAMVRSQGGGVVQKKGRPLGWEREERRDNREERGGNDSSE